MYPKADKSSVGGLKLASIAFNVISAALSLWAMVHPAPLMMFVTLLLLLPWLALALGLWFRGLLRVSARKREPGANIAPALLFPCVALCLRASDFHLLSWNSGVWLALPGAIAFFAVAMLADTPMGRPLARGIALLFVAAGYGWGCGLALNAMLDRSAGTQYSVDVTDKHVYHGRHTSYDLRLAPWGPQMESTTLSVSSRLYKKVDIGGYVCTALHDGTFGVRWYSVQSCG